MGTPRYMAPEQLLGQGVSERSDLYSLGLILYELFTGEKAFDTANLMELVELHQRGPVSPREIRPDLRPAIHEIIVGRANELRRLWSRIRTGQSTLVVGADKSGKTSLLKQVQHKYLKRKKHRSLIVKWFDAAILRPDEEPVHFWQECLEPLKSHPASKIQEALQEAIADSYDRNKLENLFTPLGDQES